MTYHHSKHETCIVVDGTCMYNCPTFFLFWKCLADMSYWTNLYLTVADNELHFFTISNLNYTVFVSLALVLCKYDVLYIHMHACINSYIFSYYTHSHYIDRQTPKENGRRKVRTGLRWKRRTLLEMCGSCDVTPLTLKGIRGETRDEYY